MGKITAVTVQEKKKDRCNLFIDGKFFAGVSLETVMKLRLKVGAVVGEKELKEILSDEEKVVCMQKATDYALKALKTKKQVKDYLLRKGFEEDTVWYCIDKLKEYGYIDDKEYSRKYIESTAKTQGKRLAEYKLMMKGVKKEDVETAYSEAETDEDANAKALADKYLKNKEKTRENALKAYKYLIGRGFSYETAKKAVSYEEDD